MSWCVLVGLCVMVILRSWVVCHGIVNMSWCVLVGLCVTVWLCVMVCTAWVYIQERTKSSLRYYLLYIQGFICIFVCAESSPPPPPKTLQL